MKCSVCNSCCNLLFAQLKIFFLEIKFSSHSFSLAMSQVEVFDPPKSPRIYNLLTPDFK